MWFGKFQNSSVFFDKISPLAGSKSVAPTAVSSGQGRQLQKRTVSAIASVR
jgi:hypothetical protein